MSGGITRADMAAIKYAIGAIETETGNSFGEDECNGKRCYRHCRDRAFCLLRAKLLLSGVVRRAEKREKR